MTSGAGSRLLLVSCGGTISSVPSGGRGATPTQSTVDLLAGLPELASRVQVSPRSAFTAASSQLTLDDAVGLVARLEAWADDADADGVVVTHGTDTLEEVAYVVDLLWRRETPVVFTGAMRHAGLPSSDGPANLLAAAATALSPAARDSGVLVVLDDRIHLACAVRKAHTTALSTFTSPTVGPVGYLSEGRPRLVLHRRRPDALPRPVRAAGQVPVALLPTPLGDDGRLLDGVAVGGFAGLVLEALGGGHVPPAVAESAVLVRLLASVPVVLASRTGAGEVLTTTYAFPGSESDLLARGLVSAGALDGPKARVLLTLLLMAGAGAREVGEGFARHGGFGA